MGTRIAWLHKDSAVVSDGCFLHAFYVERSVAGFSLDFLSKVDSTMSYQ